jgi:hypothetical protein
MLRKEEDKVILDQVKSNTKRYVEIFYEIVEKNMPSRNLSINPEDVKLFLFSNLDMILKMP